MGRVTLADLMVASDKTYRIFLLGAGFSKPAGMPLAAELLPLIEGAARDYMSVDGYNVVVELRGIEPLPPTLPAPRSIVLERSPMYENPCYMRDSTICEGQRTNRTSANLANGYHEATS